MNLSFPRRTWAVWLAGGWVTVFALSAMLAPWLPLPDPKEASAEERLAPPLSPGSPLGSDDLRRDVLSRVIYGGRSSLFVGLIAVGIGLGVGMPLGVLAGYRGGWTDRLASGLIEGLMTFPSILLALVIVASFGPSPGNVMIAVGVSQIPHYARQARASAMALANREFVDASRAAGASPWFIALWHVAPNVLAPVLVIATLGLGSAILDAAGLSFLGLTGDSTRPEWGSMVTDNREYFPIAPWTVVAPAAAITGTVLSFNILGDALRDRLDPRLRT